MDIASKGVLRFKGSSLSYIDYVLVYTKTKVKSDENSIIVSQNDNLRKCYENKLKAKGLFVEEIRDRSNNRTIVLIQTSFSSLCKEAERLCLRMPINVKTFYHDNSGCCERLVERYLATDNEEDFLSATFHSSTGTIYKDYDKGDGFFRPGLRFMMTYSILMNTNIDEEVYKPPGELKKHKALHYLINQGVYSTHFVPHSPSKLSEYFTKISNIRNSSERKKKDLFIEFDEREQMHIAWIDKWRYQPLWKIRNYFGEKTAFYFAWTGHLILCLLGPTFFGVLVFFYGLYLSISRNNVTSITNTTSSLIQVQIVVDNMLTTVKQSFDNILTPIFAAIICIWGTIFTETWKRLSNKLAFEWDVVSFDKTEPERPQFVGTDERKDPITNDDVKYFPLSKQSVRYLGSLIILLAMLLLVFGAVISIIAYRVIVTVNVCPGTTSTNCLFLNMVVTSILNAIAIIALGKVYDKLAVVLTGWENHRTQSQYDNALIFKLFSFQFVNSYSSLFYIAFFKGTSSVVQWNGIFNMGAKYIDSCGSDNNCMAMLSFQVMILMIMKPLPKLLTDVVIPFFMKRIRDCKDDKKINPDQRKKHYLHIKYYLVHEMDKPDPGDVTISEYMEKVLQYGYLVLFAASFPLAPLFALITNAIDIRVDARRLIWLDRRSVPQVVENIGIWQSIVETLNLLGVISTVLIIAFTSTWGQTLSLEYKLIFVLAAEHGLFMIKYILNVLIPDVPQSVKINMMREKFHFDNQKIMEETKSAREDVISDRLPLIHAGNGSDRERESREDDPSVL